MPQVPDEIEDTVFDVIGWTTGMPFRYIVIGHLGCTGQCGGRLDFLMSHAQKAIIDLEAGRINTGLLVKE